MSRRRDRASRAGEREPRAGEPPSVPPDTHPRRAVGRLPVQLAIVTFAFAIAVGVAELAGAANLGVAIGVGQIVFALVLIGLLSRA